MKVILILLLALPVWGQDTLPDSTWEWYQPVIHIDQPSDFGHWIWNPDKPKPVPDSCWLYEEDVVVYDTTWVPPGTYILPQSSSRESGYWMIEITKKILDFRKTLVPCNPPKGK